MKVMMWHTPKGLIDEGGKELEGYLNFNITLIAAPEDNVMSVRSAAAHALPGVVERELEALHGGTILYVHASRLSSRSPVPCQQPEGARAGAATRRGAQLS
jgi:hypothetical protein